MISGRVNRYILGSVFPPLWISFLVAAILLSLEEMLRLFDFVITGNGPVYAVWRMLVYLLPEYFNLALPIGFFLGILLAFRRLSLDNELDALAAGGISLRQLLWPLYGLSALLMVISLLLMGYVQPHSLYDYKKLSFQVRSGALGIKINAGDFVTVADGMTLRIGQIRKEGRELNDVFFENCADGAACTVTTAKRGSFLTTQDPNIILLRFYDGQQVSPDTRERQGYFLTFDVLDLPIDLPKIPAFRQRFSKGDEATFPELIRLLRSRSAPASADFNDFRANFHWRILHALAFTVIPLLAIALGVADKRRHSGTGLIVGMAIMVGYIELLQAGAVQVADGSLSPWLALWPSFIVFGALGASLFHTVAEIPGGQALAPLRDAMAWLIASARRALAPVARAWK